MNLKLPDPPVADSESTLTPGLRVSRTMLFDDPHDESICHILEASATSFPGGPSPQACFQELGELLTHEKDRLLTLADLGRTARERVKIFEAKLRWLEEYGPEAKEGEQESVAEEVNELGEWLTSVHDATRHVARFAWFRDWFAKAIEQGLFPAGTAHTQDATD